MAFPVHWLTLLKNKTNKKTYKQQEKQDRDGFFQHPTCEKTSTTGTTASRRYLGNHLTIVGTRTQRRISPPPLAAVAAAEYSNTKNTTQYIQHTYIQYNKHYDNILFIVRNDNSIMPDSR